MGMSDPGTWWRWCSGGRALLATGLENAAPGARWSGLVLVLHTKATAFGYEVAVMVAGAGGALGGGVDRVITVLVLGVGPSRSATLSNRTIAWPAALVPRTRPG